MNIEAITKWRNITTENNRNFFCELLTQQAKEAIVRALRLLANDHPGMPVTVEIGALRIVWSGTTVSTHYAGQYLCMLERLEDMTK